MLLPELWLSLSLAVPQTTKHIKTSYRFASQQNHWAAKGSHSIHSQEHKTLEWNSCRQAWYILPLQQVNSNLLWGTLIAALCHWQPLIKHKVFQTTYEMDWRTHTDTLSRPNQQDLHKTLISSVMLHACICKLSHKSIFNWCHHHGSCERCCHVSCHSPQQT